MSLILTLALMTAMTPAEMQIQTARARIEAGGTGARAYDSLAIGLTRRARETGDVSYYDEAIEALDEALRLYPRDEGTIRTSAWVRMGRHEFATAYEIACRYAQVHPDDAWNLSVMGDALMELGRYDEAEGAYQRMVDLRPGPASYSRVAYARELRGDVSGALELMRMALGATDLRETEDRAWLLVQVGHLQDLAEDLPAAEASYRESLGLFPDYHYALAALAEACLRDGRTEQALALAQAALDAAPHAERYLLLADTLAALGRAAEARRAADQFETLALANMTRNDNENHDLVLYYLDRRPDPSRALAIARHEAGLRQDVQTMDRLALALHRNGKRHAARRVMARVLATGTRDPLILEHAAEITAH